MRNRNEEAKGVVWFKFFMVFMLMIALTIPIFVFRVPCGIQAAYVSGILAGAVAEFFSILLFAIKLKR